MEIGISRPKGYIMRLLVLLAVLGLASCAGKVHVDGSTLTSGAALAAGKETPETSFALDDYVRFSTRFSWQPIDQPAGLHDVDFKWFKDGVLISKTVRRLRFAETPYSVYTARSARSLGVGHFRVETWVDNNEVGTSDFEVHA